MATCGHYSTDDLCEVDVEYGDNFEVTFRQRATGEILGTAGDYTAVQEAERLEEMGFAFDTYAVEVEFSRPTEPWPSEAYETWTRVVSGPTYKTPGEIGQDALDHQVEVWGDDEIVVEDVRSPR